MVDGPSAQQLRLVHFAILSGAVVFGVAVAVITGSNGGVAADVAPGLGTAALAVAATALPTAILLRHLLARHALGHAARDGDEEQVRRLQATSVLVPVALLEGAILLQLVVWLCTGQPMPHAAVAAALLLAGVTMAPPRDPIPE